MTGFNSLFGNLVPNTSSEGKPLDPSPADLPEVEETPVEVEEEDEPTTPNAGKAGEVPEQEGIQTDSPTPEEETGFSYLAVADVLAEEGVLIPNGEKEYEDSEEGFKELQQDTIKALFEQKYGLEDGEDLAYLAFRKQGGTNAQWLEQTTTSYQDADLEDEDTQDALLTAQYEAQGLKPEAITKKLERLTKSGTKQEEAEEAQTFLVEREAQAVKDFQAQVLQREKDQEEAGKQALVTLKKDIEEASELGGIPLNPGLKQALYQHYTKPVGPKGETQFQLNQRDKKRVLTNGLIDLLGLDSEDLTRKATTQKASKLQASLKTLASSDKTGKGSTVRTATPQGNRIPTKGMPWG